jgi:hypothetical protein
VACVGSACVPPGAWAQTGNPIPEEFDTGDDYFPVHVYLRMAEPGAPAVTLFPGEGISGVLFRDRPDDGPSWFDLLVERGFSALSVDWAGTGKVTELFNEDYLRALKAQVQDAYMVGRGSLPRLGIAHAEGAALLIKSRSFADFTSRTAVLIDPIGPQHSQPLERVSLDEALEARNGFDETLWRRWGFGPRVGELNPGLDIDLETAMRVFESYSRHAIQIRPALLQPMISPIRVRGAGQIQDWYVLIVRTPAADAAQIRREQALTEWLGAAGAIVELLDLNADPAFSTATGLPWIGSSAGSLLDRMLEWYERVVILAPESRTLADQPRS